MVPALVQVLLAIPPHPPVSRTLADVAAGRKTGAIPPTATIQVVPGGPWLPIDQVLAETGVSGPPAGVRGVLVALLVTPPVLAAVFALAFHAGAEFLFGLWGLGIALAMAAKVDRRSDHLTSAELVERLKAKAPVWYATLGLAAMLVLLACASAGLRAMRKSRADATFLERDDCAFTEKWNALSEAERSTVDYERRQMASGRGHGCDVARDDADAAEYAKACEAISARMTSKALTADDRALLRRRPSALGDDYLAGDEAVKLADRIAARALEMADLESMKALPCGPAARHPFLAAAAASPTAWSGLSAARRVDEELLRALGAPAREGGQASKVEAAPSEEVRAAVHKKAEDLAGKTQNVRSSEDAKSAVEYCMLDRRLGTKAGAFCSALIATVKRLKDAEVTRLAALEARCKATSAARKKCMRACDARQPPDELGMPAGDFDDSLACYERCEKANPATGCE